MVSTSCPGSDNVRKTSHFQKTVCLQDWWLIEAKDVDGKKLGVAGLTFSRDSKPARLFISAPIVKSFDVFTLETADGICLVVNGFINKSRTIDNGFSSEVFSHFLFGFPPYWEEYGERCLGGESIPDFNKQKMEQVPEDLRPVLTPCKYWGDIKEHEHGLDANKSTLKNVSESISTDVSEFSGMSKIDCHPCPVSSLGKNEVDVKNNDKIFGMNNDATKDYDEEEALNILPQSLDCYINDVSSLEGNIGLLEEPSTSFVGNSSEKMGHPEKSDTYNEQRLTRSKTKESSSFKSLCARNDASTGSPNLQAKGNTFDVSLSKVETNADSVSSPCNFINSRTKELSKGPQDLTGGELDWSSFGASPSESTVRLLTNCASNSKGKKKEARTSIFGLKSAKMRKKSVLMASDMMSNTLQNDTSGSSTILNSQKDGFTMHECGIEVDDSNKLAKDSGKRSQVSFWNEKLNKSVRSSDGCGDVNQRHQMETQVEGGETCAKETSCKGKTKRKLCFEAHASLHTQERKENICTPSPESLSFKRSRSGRLLLPPLEFWRNQVAIYDVAGRITGIQEDWSSAKQSGGSRSTSQKRRR